MTTLYNKPGGIKEMLSIALPMVVSQACATLMTFTDRLFLSQLGTDHMNAAMSGGLTFFLMTTFFLGLIGYSSALVAQYLGSGQKNMSAITTAQALLIALLAYPLMIAVRPGIIALFNISGIHDEQLALQTIYFNILIYLVGIDLLRNALASFFTGIGRTRIVMVAALVSLLFNVGINYVLIFGHFGIPAMGIRGAAYGTIIAGTVGLFTLVAAYFAKRIRQEFEVMTSFKINLKVIKKLWYYGYPSGLEFFLNVTAFTVMVFIFHAHSETTATAATIMFNWDMVAFVPLTGIGIGVTSLVGRYMGAGKPTMAHQSTMSGIRVALSYSGFILLLFVCFPSWLIDVFAPIQASEVFEKARPVSLYMLRMAALYVLADAITIVMTSALRGAGDTHWTMRTSVAIHWSFTPILYLILHVWGLSPQMAWTALVMFILLFCYVFYRRYKGGRWRTIKVVESR